LIEVRWDNKAMTDTPKFEVIDRRKIKAEEEKEQAPSSPVQEEKPSAPQAGPRLVVPEEKAQHLAEDLSAEVAAEEHFPDLPPAPTAEESKQQETAY
jgi:hypothetical protein